METTEQVLTRQRVELHFQNGKVEYFSVSTQWDTADTIEDAIKNILEADKKYNGKTPLNSAIDKYNSIVRIPHCSTISKELLDRLYEFTKVPINMEELKYEST